MHFWSRSRGELWHKGESSGNVQRLVQLRYDCDGDALVALVEPAGPACHTGERTCFYRDIEGSADAAKDAPAARRRARARRLRGAAGAGAHAQRAPRERPEGSYTVELLDDPELIGAKIREEADEVARAIAGESDERVAEEAADVLYHLEVGLVSREIPIARALEVLNARRR